MGCFPESGARSTLRDRTGPPLAMHFAPDPQLPVRPRATCGVTAASLGLAMTGVGCSLRPDEQSGGLDMDG
jgi:hypothetical protein